MDFKASTGEARVRSTLFSDRSAGRHHCSFVEASPTQPAWHRQSGAKSMIYINLSNTVCLTLVIPKDSAPPNMLSQPEPL